LAAVDLDIDTEAIVEAVTAAGTAMAETLNDIAASTVISDSLGNLAWQQRDRKRAGGDAANEGLPVVAEATSQMEEGVHDPDNEAHGLEEVAPPLESESRVADTVSQQVDLVEPSSLDATPQQCGARKRMQYPRLGGMHLPAFRQRVVTAYSRSDSGRGGLRLPTLGPRVARPMRSNGEDDRGGRERADGTSSGKARADGSSSSGGDSNTCVDAIVVGGGNVQGRKNAGGRGRRHFPKIPGRLASRGNGALGAPTNSVRFRTTPTERLHQVFYPKPHNPIQREGVAWPHVARKQSHGLRRECGEVDGASSACMHACRG